MNYPPCVLRLDVGASRERAITAVYGGLRWGAGGSPGGPGSPLLFSARGICVGRFLRDRDYTDLINYRRKNSKHH